MTARSWILPQAEWTGPGTPSPDALLVAERARQVVLSWAEDAPDADWRQGHLFTEDWHLSWRYLGERVRIVALGAESSANSPLPTDTWGEPGATVDLGDLKTNTREVVLWGRRQPGDEMWLELRIPNLMTPPEQHPQDHGEAHSDEHVRRTLRFVAYREPGTGEAVMSRYIGIGYKRTDGDDRTFEPLSAPGAQAGSDT